MGPTKKKIKNKNKKKPPMTTDQWLKNYIYEQVEDEDCVDNLRWAVLGDPEQMRKYQIAKDNGCCGSYDGEVTAPDGLTYAVGCNYGH